MSIFKKVGKWAGKTAKKVVKPVANIAATALGGVPVVGGAIKLGANLLNGSKSSAPPGIQNSAQMAYQTQTTNPVYHPKKPLDLNDWVKLPEVKTSMSVDKKSANGLLLGAAALLGGMFFLKGRV